MRTVCQHHIKYDPCNSKVQSKYNYHAVYFQQKMFKTEIVIQILKKGRRKSQKFKIMKFYKIEKAAAISRNWGKSEKEAITRL